MKKFYNIYNIGFKNSKGEDDETQLDIVISSIKRETLELVNLILSLQKEMDIQEVTYIDFVSAYTKLND